MPHKQFVFFGTPALAAQLGEKLAANGFVPALVVTTPDRPQGRGLSLAPSAVKTWAKKRGLPVLEPEKLDERAMNDIASGQPAFGIVVAYGKILPQKLLELPPLGFFNIHFSLLPRWRGATPVESAILANDRETGVSLQKMVAALDAGPLVESVPTEILPDETAPALRLRLTAMAETLLIDTLPRIMSGTAALHPQDESAVTLCKKIKKEDGEIDLRGDEALNYRKFRAYHGWPGTFFFVVARGKRTRVVITAADFKDGVFHPRRVIPEGRREMDYETWERSLSPTSPNSR